MSRAYLLTTTVFSVTLIVLGVAMLVRALVGGGGTLGVILGPMFVAAGAGRLWAQRVWTRRA
jgi:hypothetical protein